MKYKYETVVLREYLNKERLQENIQKVLDEKSKEGWRLSQATSFYSSGCVVLIFEQEDRF